jgi:hypothetical protein
MLQQQGRVKIYAAALSDVTIGHWMPKTTTSKNTSSGALEGHSKINHADAMRVHNGNMAACLARQDVWQQRLHDNEICVHVETELTISEMIVAATRDLQTRIRSRKCVAVNCQNTRDSGYGYATAARMLFEAGGRGSSHTVSHCGVTGFYMALEHAILLATIDHSDTIIVTAGERWLDIYPRYLGKWACFNDGASAMVANVSTIDNANAWVTNVKIENTDFTASIEVGDVSQDVIDNIISALQDLVAEARLPNDCRINLLSPHISKRFCERVHSEFHADNFGATFGLVGLGPYFGSADGLIRLDKARISNNRVNNQIQSYLIWDFEPNGLLGATLILDSALSENVLDLAA